LFYRLCRVPDADCVLEWPPAGSISQDSPNITSYYPTGVGSNGWSGIEVGKPGFDQALRDYIERHHDTKRSHPVVDWGLIDANFAAFHVVPREYIGSRDCSGMSYDSLPDFVKQLFKGTMILSPDDCEYYASVVEICDFDLLPAGDAPAIPLRMCFMEHGGKSNDCVHSFAYVCNRKTGQQAYQVITLIISIPIKLK
jgi:hypothetical protein